MLTIGSHRRRQALGKVDIQLTLDFFVQGLRTGDFSLCWLQIQSTVKTVQNTRRARIDIQNRIARRDNRRNPHRARNDRGVRSRAALSGDKAQNHIGIQVRGIGRREIIGHEYGRLLRIHHRFVIYVQQLAQNPLRHIAQIHGARSQYRIIEFGNLCNTAVNHMLPRPGGTVLLLD